MIIPRVASLSFAHLSEKIETRDFSLTSEPNKKHKQKVYHQKKQATKIG
jgi:hypothetical protein